MNVLVRETLLKFSIIKNIFTKLICSCFLFKQNRWLIHRSFGWVSLYLQAFEETVAKLLAQLPAASGSQRLRGGTERHPGGSALPWRGMRAHLIHS